MKYITIDGLSGAGKSTQARCIQERLGWNELNREEARTVNEMAWKLVGSAYNLGVNLFAEVISNIAVLRRAIDSQRDNFVVGDHYWGLLWHCYMHPNDGNVNQLLDVFMATFADTLPVASFFLKTDPRLRNIRILHRNANVDGYFSIESVEVEASHNGDDGDALQYFEWLQSKVDSVPIHIIDNTDVSIEEVTSQILEKITAQTAEQHGQDRGY